MIHLGINSVLSIVKRGLPFSGVEIIDFTEDEEEADEDDDGDHFFSSSGRDRVSEALHAHMWSSRVDNKHKKKKGEDRVAPPPPPPETEDDGSNKSKGEGDDRDDFEALFAQFAQFKAGAAGLEGADRRKYAEQVTRQFWSALGGDPEELDGLGDP